MNHSCYFLSSTYCIISSLPYLIYLIFIIIKLLLLLNWYKKNIIDGFDNLYNFVLLSNKR